nr:lytic transglycosylase domain-containing protein [Pseudomonadota bacterium]
PLVDVSVDQPEKALVHALIRQESTFNAGAISSAGARGLMQLMPATARQVARQEGLPHQPARLTEDPAYNIRLGAAYLERMLDQFGGSPVLAIAAYNAGPSRVREWVGKLGQPGDRPEEVVDWIEQIPFSETRNYVQRVLENLQVYRQRLGEGNRNGLAHDLVRTTVKTDS